MDADITPERIAELQAIVENGKKSRHAKPEHFDRSMIVTRESIAARQAEREKGQPFNLPWTGGAAIVRELNLFDRTVTDTLPGQIQSIIAEMMFPDRGPKAGAKDAPSPTARMNKYLKDNDQVGRALCIRGFVEPRLVATELEELNSTDPTVLWVERIDVRDRNAYSAMIVEDSSNTEGSGIISSVAEFHAAGETVDALSS